MDTNQDNLLIKLEALQNTLKQRNEDCENNEKRIADLEIALQKVGQEPSQFQEFQVEQVQILQNTLKTIYEQHKTLQEKFFNMMAKKNYYKKNYKLLQESQKNIPSRTLSEAELSNEQLRKEIVELKVDIQAYKEENKMQKQQAINFQTNYENGLAELEKFKKTAEEHFELIKQKMYDAREGKADPEEIAQLKEENEVLQTNFDELNEKVQQLSSSQADFVNSLSSVLGCQPELPEIVQMVKKTVPLKIENQKLKMEIDNLKILGTVDQNEAYTNIIESLREMQSKLSPDELHLNINSPLKQLFAAISNMINAAISPNASKVVLQSHVRSVYYQARAFKKEDLDESMYNVFLNKNEQVQDNNNENGNSLNFSPKMTAIDAEIGNTFSAISSNSRINNFPSNIEFPPVKSSD